jgi:16S rRNA (guanine966-N2)-methyltransferase
VIARSNVFAIRWAAILQSRNHPITHFFTMRIISGKFRGLHLATLKGGALRPTSDQLRETLFNVLGPEIEGRTFLDAYAGTGAVGIEALSRGASEVVFIEHHRPSAALIRKNLGALKIEDGFYLMTCAALKGLDRLEEEDSHFDYIFLDPPYDEIREYHHVLRQLARSGLLHPTSLVIAEHSRHCNLEEQYGKLWRIRLLKRGDSQLGFYKRADT